MFIQIYLKMKIVYICLFIIILGISTYQEKTLYATDTDWSHILYYHV